jgi:alpha-beta hydrolase superfamily lysophospholipase
VSDSFPLTMSDGVDIVVYRWLPSTEPTAVVQIAHGASEHAARYARLAGELNEAGYAVYADDHRGHGRTAGQLERFGVAGEDTWNRMVEDERELTDHIAKAHPGVPVVLLGHSMGSFIVQDYIQRWSDGLRGAVVTGTASSPVPGAEGLRERLEAAIAEEGRDVPSMQFVMLFVGFNDPFVDSAPEGGPTGFEWLSRDPAEVRKYVEDSWCGLPLSNGFVHDMATALDRIWEEGSEASIAKDLPILIMAGDQDPVGRFGESVRELTERYRRAGLPVTERLYRDARHEVFNESNRDEVHRDLLAWLRQVLA